MEYLIRFKQIHETFRQAETDALADLLGITIEWLSYSDDVSRLPCGVSVRGDLVKATASRYLQIAHRILFSHSVQVSSHKTEGWQAWTTFVK